MASGNKTYAPLPFSYLTGGSAPENTPTYGVKTSVSHEGTLERPSASDNDPYSIFAGKPQTGNGVHAARKHSIDITDPQLDVTDPYLLSTGRLSKEQSSSSQDISNDPRYRDSVPSESDGDNVFFKPPQGEVHCAPSPKVNPEPRSRDQVDFYPAPSLQRTGAYTNPDADHITRDEDPGKKLPRYKVDSDTGYQFYSGNNGVQTRGASPAPKTSQGGMESAHNPVWDKYYAGGAPPVTTTNSGAPQTSPGYGGYPPTSPGIRPTTKEDDFNTLLRNSSGSDLYSKGCCKSRRCAIAVAVVLTAIICLGGGFAAGWFIHETVNSPAATTTTTTVTEPPMTTSPTLPTSHTTGTGAGPTISTAASTVSTTNNPPAPTPSTTTTTTTTTPSPATSTTTTPTPAPVTTPSSTAPTPTTTEPITEGVTTP